jgi:hypothetical protein
LAHVSATRKAVGKNGRLLISLERPFDRRRPTIRQRSNASSTAGTARQVAHSLARSQTQPRNRGEVVANVQAAIREADADAIALILRGCLVEGDVIAEAALSAQPKAKHGSDATNGN